jgi:hypothetical protein
MVAQSCRINRSRLIGAHDHDRSMGTQDNLLDNTAHVPATQAALPVTAEHDERDIILVRKPDDPFSRRTF